jgi:hypothetical protein
MRQAWCQATCSPFRPEAERDIEYEYGGDHSRVGPFPHDEGDARRGDQQGDDDAGELPCEHPPRRLDEGRVRAIGSPPYESGGRLPVLESAGGARYLPQHALAIERVPRGGARGVACVRYVTLRGFHGSHGVNVRARTHGVVSRFP